MTGHRDESSLPYGDRSHIPFDDALELLFCGDRNCGCSGCAVVVRSGAYDLGLISFRDFRIYLSLVFVSAEMRYCNSGDIARSI